MQVTEGEINFFNRFLNIEALVRYRDNKMIIT